MSDETSETPTVPDTPPAAVEVPVSSPDAPAAESAMPWDSEGPPASREAVTASLTRLAEQKREELAKLEAAIRQQSHTEYPQVLYHRTHGAKTVQSVDERNALGTGWIDHPEKD